MLRIPHCLDNRLTNVRKVVTLRTGRALFIRKIISVLLVIISVRHRITPEPSAAGRIR
jgi:hypothetical protein